MITFSKNNNYYSNLHYYGGDKYYIEEFEIDENLNNYSRYTDIDKNRTTLWLIKDENTKRFDAIYPDQEKFKDLELAYKHFKREQKLKRILE